LEEFLNLQEPGSYIHSYSLCFFGCAGFLEYCMWHPPANAHLTPKKQSKVKFQEAKLDHKAKDTTAKDCDPNWTKIRSQLFSSANKKHMAFLHRICIGQTSSSTDRGEGFDREGETHLAPIYPRTRRGRSCGVRGVDLVFGCFFRYFVSLPKDVYLYLLL